MVSILKSYGIISGLIGILIVVVMISGCTSTTKDPKTDIVNSGDLSGQWNGPSGEWLIVGNIESKSNSKYSNVTVLLTAYDAKGNIVGNKTTQTHIDGGYTGYIQTIINVKSQPDHVNMTILNAIPV